MTTKIEKYYSLAEITGSIRNMIAKTYHSAYWVKAEIVKMNCYPYSGHCYPDLVEKKENKIIAQIRATLWSGTFQVIRKKFMDETGEMLSEGMTVLFLVRVTYHEIHGLSLNILDVEPSFTLGEMARGRKEAVEKLKKEGIFDQNKRLPFPLLPKKVAVISVETSKGYHDFLKILENNRYGYRIEHTLFSALLQGDNAVNSIVSQLKDIASHAELFDVVTIIRGGGGDVGLNAYDHYKLAKAIAEFPLPVITGIGHSTNETVAEMVAHANKITPTEVATFLLEKFENFHAVLEDLTFRLSEGLEEFFAARKQELEQAGEVIRSSVSNVVERNKARLVLLNEKLKNSVSGHLQKEKSVLGQLTMRLYFKPEKVLSAERSGLTRLTEKLQVLIKQPLRSQKVHLEHLETKLKLLSPENILHRGYSLTLVNGKLAKSVADVAEGDQIKTLLKGGEILSKVEKIAKTQKNE